MKITLNKEKFGNDQVVIDISNIKQLKQLENGTQVILRYESHDVLESIAEIKELMKETKE